MSRCVKQVRATPAEIQTVREMVAAGHFAQEIANKLGRTRSSVIGLADRHKLGPWMSSLQHPRAIPDDFADRWRGTRHKALAQHYDCSVAMIARWVKTLGLVRPPAAVRPVAKPRLVSTRVHGHKPALFTDIYRDQSPAGLAADVLRKDRWIVYRCNESRAQSQGGKFWMCGRVLCTDAELIERAERAARKMAA